MWGIILTFQQTVMRLIYTRFTLIFTALMLLLTGCEENEQSVLTPDRQTIDATAKGGKLTITYQISGSSKATTVTAASEQEWINSFDTSNSGIINFNVDKNESAESREGYVTITFSGSESQITVRQAGYEEEFEIVTSTTPSSISYCIVPKDKSMTYMYSILDKESYSKYGSADQIFDEEIQRFKENATKFGKTLEEYLDGILHSGDSEVTTMDLIMPSTEFFIYVYGLNPDGEKTTNVIVSPIATKEIEKTGTVFNISHEMNGNLVTISIAPENESQTYIWKNVLKKDLSDDLINECQKEIFSKVTSYRNNGMADSDILSYIATKGSLDQDMKLEVTTDYVTYAIEIDNQFLLVSDPTIVEYTTPGYEVSDNVLTMEMKDIRGHYGKCCITPSNEDTYVVFCKEYSVWEGMSDEEIIESLTNGRDLTNQRVKGYYEVYSRGFKEKTTYAFVAFGYNNKMPTTKLFKTIFTTTEAEISKDITMNLAFDKYYDGTELESLYPDKFKGASGYAVLPVKAENEGYVMDYYYQAFEGDYTETGTDDELIQMLIIKGIRCVEESALYIPYDKVYTLVGAANDMMGDYTKVIREKINLTKDGATPAEEYPAE